MADAAFIPAIKGGALTSMVKPSEVYFGQKESSNNFHSQLFTFVDFGPKANTFLRAVGVKDEPTIQEICQMLLRNPKVFFDTVGSAEG